MEPAIGTDQHPAGVRLFILGGFRLERDGQRLPERVWQRRSAKRLVKLLATNPAHRVHREQVQELLWPELPPDKAANALRKALHMARRAFEPELGARHTSSFLQVRDDLVQLGPEPVWIDAFEFQASAEAALADGEQAGLERALAMYGGELLPEDLYDDWTTGPRLMWADLHLALLRELAAVHERWGRSAAAIACLKQVVGHDPIREHVHRQIMRLYAESGERHQALRQYQACRAALHDQLDAEPDPVTERLYQEIQAGRIAVVSAAAKPLPSGTLLPLPNPARRRLTEPLVGREQMVAALGDALDRAERGHGGMVLLGGEAGVGKTRLIAELARKAHDRKGNVAWGTCDEPVAQVPYGPLVEALDRVGAAQAPDVRHHLGTAYPLVAQLIPSLGSAVPTAEPPPSADNDRTRLFAAVARMLDEIRGNRVLLLVLDDLHAADSAMLQLLNYLARLAAERPWLIVGSFREEEVTAGSEFQRLCSALVQAGLGRRFDLDRLTKHGCDSLIDGLLSGGTVSDALRDDIYHRSLGNPLYIYELVRTMRDQGTLTLADESWTVVDDSPTTVPRRLLDLIEIRVDRLGDTVKSALALIATATRPCSYRVLRETGLFSDESLLDALDRALSARFLDEGDEGYGFAHPLIRGTIYERLTQPRRTLLHAALANAIQRQPAPDGESPERVEDLAHHWAEAGNVARAVPYLARAAGNAAQVYANDEAIVRLRRALSLLANAPEAHLDGPYRRGALLERLGDLLALAGRSAEALEAFAEALYDPRLDDLDPARLQRKAARHALATGDLAHADRLLTEAAARLAEAPSATGIVERARLLTVQSQAHYLGYRFSEALAAAEASVSLATEAGSMPDVAQATEMVAMACLTLGQWRRGMDYERSFASLTDLNQFVRDAADIHLCLGEYFVHREPEQSVRNAETFIRALAESERIGAPRSVALCHYYLGYAVYFGGRFREAVSHLTESIRLYDKIGSASGKAIALMMRGVTRTALGLLDEGRRDLEQGLEATEHATLRSHASIRLYAALGRNRLDANDPAGARRAVEAGLALVDEPSTCICYAAIHPIAATAFALTGDVDRATELGQRALAQAKAINSPAFLIWSYQAIAITDAMIDDWGSAFAALDTARVLAERYAFPYECGRILLLRAFVHMRRRRARDLAAATALTAEASAILIRLGVRASSAQARSSLGFVRTHLSGRPQSAHTSAYGVSKRS